MRTFSYLDPLKKMNITFEPAQKSDADFIALTVMGALGEELCLSLADGEENLPKVTRLFKRLAESDNAQYSYLNTTIARIGGRPVGALIAYDGRRLHELRKAFVDAANDILNWDITEDEFSQRGDETGPGEVYIDSLYVAPEYRGTGIARGLIGHVVSRQPAETFGLLVEPENERAKRLYENLGFKKVGVNHFFSVPMYHMQLSGQ